jgi:hypothetical protein
MLTADQQNAKDELETAVVKIEHALKLLDLEDPVLEDGAFRQEMQNLIDTNPEDVVSVAATWRQRFLSMTAEAKKAAETFVSDVIERLNLTDDQAKLFRTMVDEIDLPNQG